MTATWALCVIAPEVAVTVRANVAQSLEEAKMQAAGIDPLTVRDEDDEMQDDEGASPAA